MSLFFWPDLLQPILGPSWWFVSTTLGPLSLGPCKEMVFSPSSWSKYSWTGLSNVSKVSWSSELPVVLFLHSVALFVFMMLVFEMLWLSSVSLSLCRSPLVMSNVSSLAFLVSWLFGVDEHSLALFCSFVDFLCFDAFASMYYFSIIVF